MSRMLIVGTIAATIVALSPVTGDAQTDQIRFQGSTRGCFSSLDACDTTAESLQYGDNILKFTGGSFNATTRGGDLEFNGTTNRSLGYFSWTNFTGWRTYLSPFNLAINLLTPTGVD